MTSLTVNASNRGQVVLTNGTLNGITINNTPDDKSDREYFCLVNNTPNGNQVLFNLLISTNPVGRNLMTNASISYTNLTVQSIPAGSIFDFEYT
jgi:hypothetical protein